MKQIEFKIFYDRVHRNYTIKRYKGTYKQHGHFNNRKAASTVRLLINAGLLARDPFMKKAQQRLLTSKEFAQLKEGSLQ